MSDIRENMLENMPDGLLWLDIFLSTGRTVSSGGFVPAVQTYFFRSDFTMRHPANELKIKILAIINTGFFRLENRFKI